MIAISSSDDDHVAIRCEGLHKRYPTIHAVRGVDLTVARGECLALLGPNGAGKTTTVEMIEGLTEPSEGSISIFGRTWGSGADVDRAIRGSIGVCLQESSFQERLSINETIDLFRSFYPDPVSREELVALVSLQAKATDHAGKLSGGQRQRLALACALAGRPRLLYLDEPSTGLDPQSRRQVYEIIKKFQSGGGTVLLTTHYMDEARLLADSVAIMDAGQIIVRGTTLDLIASLGAGEIATVVFDRPVDKESFAGMSGLAGAVLDAVGTDNPLCTLRFAAQNLSFLLPEILRIAALAQLAVVSIATHSATLEDVFIHYTGRGLRDG